MTLRDQAYQQIHDRILSGELRAGEVVSEAELAKQLGISRTPVREAIRHLQAAGLVDQIPRYGTVVRQPEYRDIIELFQLRVALETFSLSAAAGKISEGAYRTGREYCRQILDIGREMKQSGSVEMDKGQLNRFLTADMSFHMIFLNAAGNERHIRLLTDARAQIRSCGAGRPDHSLQTIVRAYQYHRRILRYAWKSDVAQARFYMEEHLRDSLQGTLAHMYRIESSQKGEVLFSLTQSLSESSRL